MGTVDFEQWAVPDLVLTFRGRDYLIPPPTVDAAAVIMASAVRGEVNLGLVKGPVPDEVQAVLDRVGTSKPALTQAVYDQMAADGIPKTTIERFSFYAVFYWARGKAYADALARVMWEPVKGESAGGSGDGSPKG